MMPNARTDAASQAAKNIFSFAALSFKTAVEAGQVMTPCVCVRVCVCVCVCECVCVSWSHQVISGQSGIAWFTLTLSLNINVGCHILSPFILIFSST